MDHLLRNHKALSSHLILTTDLNLCGRPKCEQNWCKSGEEFKAFPKYIPQYILEQSSKALDSLFSGTVQSRFSDIKFSDNLSFSDYFTKTVFQFTT